MGPFLWLFWMTAAAVWPFYAVAVAILIGIAVHRRREPSPAPRLSLRPLVALLIAPVALTVWSSFMYRAEEGTGRVGWASNVLLALGIGNLILIVWVLWTWRRRWLAALPVAVAALAATLVACFVGAMAIVNDWV